MKVENRRVAETTYTIKFTASDVFDMFIRAALKEAGVQVDSTSSFTLEIQEQERAEAVAPDMRWTAVATIVVPDPVVVPPTMSAAEAEKIPAKGAARPQSERDFDKSDPAGRDHPARTPARTGGLDAAREERAARPRVQPFDEAMEQAGRNALGSSGKRRIGGSPDDDGPA